MLERELTDQLGYEHNEAKGRNSDNSRGEGSNFWLSVITALQSRGVEDIWWMDRLDFWTQANLFSQKPKPSVFHPLSAYMYNQGERML